MQVTNEQVTNERFVIKNIYGLIDSLIVNVNELKSAVGETRGDDLSKQPISF